MWHASRTRGEPDVSVQFWWKEHAVNVVFRRPPSVLLLLVFVAGVLAATPSLAQRQRRREFPKQKRRELSKQTDTKEPPPSPSPSSATRFTPADNGRTVHDAVLHVTWLLDANVGKSECHAGTGGMDWKTAWACVRQLNDQSFLGHSDWQLPATPTFDTTCSATGPQGNSFARNCTGSAYGSLYYLAWRRQFGDAVALQTGPTRGGFSNLQPTLYWFGNSLQQESGRRKRNPYSGYNSFSFSNGWQGANVNEHVIHILPVIAGSVPPGSPAAQATVYDATADSGVAGKTGISWLADANIASNPGFLQQVKAGNLPISRAGSMEQKTAQQLVALMRQHKYLGRDDWMLPLASATNCTINGRTGGNAGYGCTVSGMGHLYYAVLMLKPGDVVAEPPDVPEVNPFHDVQPSLYWACTAADPNAATGALANRCSSTPTAAPGFGFSFDMGSGFTDTTLIASKLYLMVYYPDPPQH
jgi:hypothetical protein